MIDNCVFCWNKTEVYEVIDIAGEPDFDGNLCIKCLIDGGLATPEQKAEWEQEESEKLRE